MIRKIKKGLYWLRLFIFMNFVRSWLSPLIYWLARLFVYDLPAIEFWEDISDKPQGVFSDKINSFDYRPQWFRLFDFSPQEKNYFFRHRRYNRDCAHFARMWYWYNKRWGRDVKEIALTDLDGGGSHIVTVAKNSDGNWGLFDYTPRVSDGLSINEVLQYNSVGFKNFVWVEYKEIGRVR